MGITGSGEDLASLADLLDARSTAGISRLFALGQDTYRWSWMTRFTTRLPVLVLKNLTPETMAVLGVVAREFAPSANGESISRKPLLKSVLPGTLTSFFPPGIT